MKRRVKKEREKRKRGEKEGGKNEREQKKEGRKRKRGKKERGKEGIKKESCPSLILFFNSLEHSVLIKSFSYNLKGLRFLGMMSTQRGSREESKVSRGFVMFFLLFLAYFR